MKKQLFPNLNIEEEYKNKVVCGVDEAGRGALAGPVVAAAIILDKNNIPEGIKDSKLLSSKAREKIFYKLKISSMIGIGIIESNQIDDLNILNATIMAMEHAILKLKKQPDLALIDGNRAPSITVPCKTIIKGDKKVLSIAAASIAAKYTRDMIMNKLASKWPYYSWEKNLGYGTKHHIEMIYKNGVSIYHRKTFKPISIILKNNTEQKFN